MKIYISGKISDLSPSEVKHRFSTAENQLKEIGYLPVNPLNVHDSDNKTWKEFMLRDIEVLFNCEAIYMLNNWRSSKGARIEHAIAVETGIKILYQP